MSNINQIGAYLGSSSTITYPKEYTYKDRGIKLEKLLTDICNKAEEIAVVTGNRNVDIDYLLGIVGSYIVGIKNKTLKPEDTEPPAVLFEESLFPSLDNSSGIITAEVIEEEADGEQPTDTEDEGHAS